MLKFKMVCWSNCVAYEDSEITHEFESIDVITAEDYAESYIHSHDYIDVGNSYDLYICGTDNTYKLVDFPEGCSGECSACPAHDSDEGCKYQF